MQKMTSLTYFSSFRQGIAGSCVKDSLIMCCCFCCATYQVASELSSFDKYLDEPMDQSMERAVD